MDGVLKRSFETLQVKYAMLRDRKAIASKELEESDTSRIFHLECVNFLTSFAEWSRERVKVKLETLVNSALSFVFPDKQMFFKLIGKKTKTGLQYDIYIETDGTITSVFDAKGGGVLDIASLALRIAYLKLYEGSLGQVLILDEPFKNLDIERISNAVAWLSHICKELGIMIITATHITELVNSADSVFAVSMENGISRVEKLQNNIK
jgi:DNA repair exonuclease SbcCD ATPase subunit